MKNIKEFLNNKNVQWILSTIIFLTSLFIFTFVLCNIYKSRNNELNPKTDGETTSININGTTVTNESGNTVATIIDEETGEEVTVVIDSDTGEVLRTTTNPETGEVITKVITTKPTVPKTEPTTKLRMNVDKIVNNIDELKESNLSVGKTIHTNGYYSANDGGEGYYRVEAKSNQVIDNGKYILLNNGLVASLIPIDNTYNVKQFGAKGDSKTDDTESLKRALKAVSGYTVYFPKGTYMLSNYISIYSNTKIIGDGEESLIMAVDEIGVEKTLLSISEMEKIEISDIAVSGNIEHNTREMGHSDQRGIHLLDIGNSTNITITNCIFKDNVYAAVRMIKNASNMTFKNNKFLNVDCGVASMGKGEVNDILVDSNYFDGHYASEPITMFGTGTYKNLIFNNNIMKNKTIGSGVYIGFAGARTYGAKITNNKIYDCAGGINIKYADDVLVENNYLNFSDLDLQVGGGLGIRLIESSNAKVLNNKIVNAGQFAIRNESGTNILYKGNVVENGARSNKDFTFVDFFGTNNNVVFEENKISRLDSTLTPNLLSVSGDGGVTIKNNQFENGKIWLRSTSANIIVSGNNVEVRDQGTNNIIN